MQKHDDDTALPTGHAATARAVAAAELLGAVHMRVMTAVARIDPETPLGVSFDAR